MTDTNMKIGRLNLRPVLGTPFFLRLRSDSPCSLVALFYVFVIPSEARNLLFARIAYSVTLDL